MLFKKIVFRVADFRRESITVRLTSCLTCLDLTKQINVMLIQDKQSMLNTHKLNRRSAKQICLLRFECCLYRPVRASTNR